MRTWACGEHGCAVGCVRRPADGAALGQEVASGLSRTRALRRADALAALGRKLFFDPLLSGSGKCACATCHDPKFGYGRRMHGRSNQGERRYAMGNSSDAVSKVLADYPAVRRARLLTPAPPATTAWTLVLAAVLLGTAEWIGDAIQARIPPAFTG